MNRSEVDIQSIVEKESLFVNLLDSRILVTGATGLIGSMLIKTLVEANNKYRLRIHIIGQIRNPEKAKSVLGDVLDCIELTSSYDTEADYIIHTVSPTTSKFFIEHPVETIKSSVMSTISILDAAKKYNAAVVYLSSMEQYGIPYVAKQHMSEEMVGVIDHLNIRSSYSESKRLCECLCVSYSSEFGVNVKIARLAQTIGAGAPLSDNRMPMQFARAVVEEKDIVLHTEGKSISNFVYLTDAISGILTILAKGRLGNAYNVCNDRETRSVRDIAELVCHDVADDKIRVIVEKKENMGYAPDVELYLDSGKLRALGWKAEVGMADAYKRLVEYIRMTEMGDIVL